MSEETRIGDSVLHLGDCIEVLPSLAEASIDAVVTDPPAGIEFMGKEWDRFRRARNPNDAGRDGVFGRVSRTSPASGAEGRRAGFLACLIPIFTECLRVLKPGGHALVWALPRTSHWTGTALEEAGFEIRDIITHHFGSGFPKSRDVGKAIDKAAGAERPVVGRNQLPDVAEGRRKNWECTNTTMPGCFGATGQSLITSPVTEEAMRWEGWGTALKPATEFWWLCRKPFKGKTVEANVLRHGTGALNIDGCRIEGACPAFKNMGGAEGMWGLGSHTFAAISEGRWPANLVLSHSSDCVPTGETRNSPVSPRGWVASGGCFFGGRGLDNFPQPAGFWGGPDRREEVAVWRCAPDCPVRILDEQTGYLSGPGNVGPRKCGSTPGNVFAGFGNGHLGDAPHWHDREGGPPSRFFYVAKASRAEREEGLEGMDIRAFGMSGGAQQVLDTGGEEYAECQGIGLNRIKKVRNDHPTVKPVELMRWLCRLVTPPGGTVLDPFLGSGTTGVACVKEGFHLVGMENDKHYFEIARRRIEAAGRQGRMF